MRFSILLPTADRREFLPRALASIEAQTFSDWQAIVFDNGDESVADLVPYDERFVYYRGEADGPAEAFQRALELATGEIIHPIGDDDRLAPAALEAVDEAIGGYEWLVGKTLGEDENGTTWIAGAPADAEQLERVYYLGGAVYWKRALSDRLGGFDRAFDGAADFDLYLRFARAAPAAFLDEVLYLYTDHPGTDSRVRADNQREKTAKIVGPR